MIVSFALKYADIRKKKKTNYIQLLGKSNLYILSSETIILNFIVYN